VPFVRPLAVHDVPPVVVHRSPPGEEVAVYPVMAEPPLELGAVQETVDEALAYEVAFTEVGAPGTVLVDRFAAVRTTVLLDGCPTAVPTAGEDEGDDPIAMPTPPIATSAARALPTTTATIRLMPALRQLVDLFPLRSARQSAGEVVLCGQKSQFSDF
jgi:hypothetical protein